MFDKNEIKYLKMMRNYFLSLFAGMIVFDVYNAYHEFKEYDKISLIQELENGDDFSFSFYEEYSDSYVLSINCSSADFKFSNENYKKLNEVLSNDAFLISKLKLSGLGSELDFSKVDLTRISSVSFEEMKEDFDYSAFSNNNYSSLSFFNIPLNDSLKKFFEDTNLEYSVVEISNEDVEVLSCLKEFGNSPNILEVNVYGGYFSDNILPQISARRVDINYYFDHHLGLDIDFSFSNKVEEANFMFSMLPDIKEDIYISDIAIDSSNSDLEISFINEDIDNLSMEIIDFGLYNFPTGAYVNFKDIDYNGVEFFSNLNNLSGFSYTDTKGYEITYANPNYNDSKVKKISYH